MSQVIHARCNPWMVDCSQPVGWAEIGKLMKQPVREYKTRSQQTQLPGPERAFRCSIIESENVLSRP